jgi:hypothetical protein
MYDGELNTAIGTAAYNGFVCAIESTENVMGEPAIGFYMLAYVDVTGV